MGGFAPHFSEPRACEGGKSHRLTQTPGMSSLGLVGLRRSEISLGACPSIGTDCVTSAMGRDTRRRARNRCHSASSARNKVDRLLGNRPPGSRGRVVSRPEARRFGVRVACYRFGIRLSLVISSSLKSSATGSLATALVASPKISVSASGPLD